MDHLNDVKAKLEKTLDQMDAALESKSVGARAVKFSK
jgi:hypothetical protein